MASASQVRILSMSSYLFVDCQSPGYPFCSLRMILEPFQADDSKAASHAITNSSSAVLHCFAPIGFYTRSRSSHLDTSAMNLFDHLRPDDCFDSLRVGPILHM